MYVCMYGVYVCMYVWYGVVCVYVCVVWCGMYVCMYVCMYVGRYGVYVCMYVWYGVVWCMYVCLCMYVCYDPDSASCFNIGTFIDCNEERISQKTVLTPKRVGL